MLVSRSVAGDDQEARRPKTVDDHLSKCTCILVSSGSTKFDQCKDLQTISNHKSRQPS